MFKYRLNGQSGMMIVDLRIKHTLRRSLSREFKGFAILGDEDSDLVESARQIKMNLGRWQRDPNVKLHLSLKSSQFLAGGLIEGNIQIKKLTSDIRLSCVKVTLMGVEETIGKMLPNRKAFLLRQATVLEHDDIINRSSKSGVTTPIMTFNFELSLPKELPSSFAHPWAAVRYVLFCESTFSYTKSQSKSITTCAQREILILENIAPSTLTPWLTTCVLGELNCQPSLFTLESEGVVRMVVKLAKKAWVAGSPLVVGFLGSNLSEKKITCIRLRLNRKVMIFDDHQFVVPIHRIKSTLSQATFKDQATLQGFDHSEFDLSLLLEIPVSSFNVLD
ncbi:hypothetical protein L0F63_003411 [Massospora cicadina]|nr:hypothetical protein L0F63_003411 [Massospora cicadina]